MKISLLNRINELYKNNGNIMSFLRNETSSKFNTIEDILISYDFQAGTYVENYKNNPIKKDKVISEISTYINKLDPVDSMLEIGVGEATSLVALLNRLESKPKDVKGIDLSWSRLKVGSEFLKENKFDDVQLATSDLFELPLKDNSVELLYTFHSLEPNGGNEEAALRELYRVTNKYMVLVEPCYEIANEEQKQRMENNGYVRGLYGKCLELGYNVILNEKIINNENPLNPATIIIIEKNADSFNSMDWCCPITKTTLKSIDGTLFSDESLLAYPIISSIPCLISNNAIVATKMSIANEEIDKN